MAQNLKLNPMKRDYAVVNGSPVPSDRVEEATYYAVQIPQNKWLYGQAGQGSLVYTLQNRKRDASVEKDFAAFAKDAVTKQVVNTGKATAVAVRNLATSPTGTSNEIDVTPSQTPISNQLNFVSV